jgi:hypothetical protein
MPDQQHDNFHSINKLLSIGRNCYILCVAL